MNEVLFSTIQVPVLQVMDSHYQLAERKRCDRVFPSLKASYCALSKSGPAREKLSGKLFCFCPYLFQIFRINNSFVLAEGFIHSIYGSGFGHHGQIGTGRPARRCLFADVMKLTCNDVPTHEQSNCIAIASAPVRSANTYFRFWPEDD